MIKDFIKNFVLQSAGIEFESGKKVCLKDACNIEINENSVLAQIENYKAEFCIDLKEENVYSFSAKLTPLCKKCDKAHKITEFKITSPYNENTYMLINHTAKEGIVSVSNLPKECSLRDFCSFYQADNTQNAVTVATKLPAKFRSDIAVSKNDEEFTLEASTTIPYSYEGEIICQEWILYFNMPTIEALAKNADRFSLKQEFQNPIGWSTWDYYFTSATEDDVKENVDFIANDEVLSKKVRYIALDDGWQHRFSAPKSCLKYGIKKNLIKCMYLIFQRKKRNTA